MRRRRSGLVHWKISYYNRARLVTGRPSIILYSRRAVSGVPPARLARATPHSSIEE